MSGNDSETESERHFEGASDDETLNVTEPDSPKKALSSNGLAPASVNLQVDLPIDRSPRPVVAATDPSVHESQTAVPAPAQGFDRPSPVPVVPSEFVSPFASLAAESYALAAAKPANAGARCDECSAVLCPPDGTVLTGDVEPACCDCCRRVLPRGMIDLRPSGASVSLCLACHARYVVDVDDEDSSKRTIGDTWIQQLEQIYEDVRDQVAKAVATTKTTCLDVKQEDANAKLTLWKERAADLKIRQKAALSELNASFQHTHVLYREQVRTDHSLVKALTSSIVMSIGKIIELLGAIPPDTIESIVDLFKDRQTPQELASFLAQATDKQVLPHPVDLDEPTHCEKCTGALMQSDPTDTKELGYCDCCRRVLPQSSIAVRSPDLRSTVCFTCHSAHLVSQYPRYFDTLTKRVEETHIQELTKLSETLQPLLVFATRDGISAVTRAASDKKVEAARQAVNKLRKQRQRRLIHDKKTFGHSCTTVSTSQAMYTNHVKIDSALVDALMHLLRVQAEAVSLRRVKPSAKAMTGLRAFGIHIGQSGFILSRPKASKKRGRSNTSSLPRKAPAKKRKVTSKAKPKPNVKPTATPKRRLQRMDTQPDARAPNYTTKLEPTVWHAPRETKVKSEPSVKIEF